MRRTIKHTPPRLHRIFDAYSFPLYFLTICTFRKQRVLATPSVHAAFKQYARTGEDTGRALVGDYVLMPDHIHLFVRLDRAENLGVWVRGLKRKLTPAIRAQGATDVWQPGFFDHLLRSGENYADKWAYVRQNPVRAGLVAKPDEWSFAGRISILDRV